VIGDLQAYRNALKDIEAELRVLAGRLQSVADLAHGLSLDPPPAEDR
jgi:hypothetical protein